jgi:hypothetical protein
MNSWETLLKKKLLKEGCKRTACHTAWATMRELTLLFGQQIISKGLWPPRSPDLSPPDSFLWGYIKSNAYRNSPSNLDETENQHIQHHCLHFNHDSQASVYEHASSCSGYVCNMLVHILETCCNKLYREHVKFSLKSPLIPSRWRQNAPHGVTTQKQN